jgi:hypothetical protein
MFAPDSGGIIFWRGSSHVSRVSAAELGSLLALFRSHEHHVVISSGTEVHAPALCVDS